MVSNSLNQPVKKVQNNISSSNNTGKQSVVRNSGNSSTVFQNKSNNSKNITIVQKPAINKSATQKQNGQSGKGTQESIGSSAVTQNTIQTPNLSATTSLNLRSDDFSSRVEDRSERVPSGFIPLSEYNQLKRKLDETLQKLDETEKVLFS